MGGVLMWELDGAIKWYEIRAGEMHRNVRLALKANNQISAERDQVIADEYAYTAKWLKELKAYREANQEIRALSQVWEEGAGIKKCINIINKHVEEEED